MKSVVDPSARRLGSAAERGLNTVCILCAAGATLVSAPHRVAIRAGAWAFDLDSNGWLLQILDYL